MTSFLQYKYLLQCCHVYCRPALQVKALGCDGSTSLASWLDGLGLHEYLPNFLSSGYRTLECVKNLWELEIVNVRSHDLHCLSN